MNHGDHGGQGGGGEGAPACKLNMLWYIFPTHPELHSTPPTLLYSTFMLLGTLKYKTHVLSSNPGT